MASSCVGNILYMRDKLKEISLFPRLEVCPQPRIQINIHLMLIIVRKYGINAEFSARLRKVCKFFDQIVFNNNWRYMHVHK